MEKQPVVAGASGRVAETAKQGLCCAGSCRSLELILSAVGSHLIWEAVLQGKGSDCCAENEL